MDFFVTRQKKAFENWSNQKIKSAASDWHNHSRSVDYQYMFQSCGLPIIQDPQDICMLQDLIWEIKPTLIIETGVARGGSLMLSAFSLAALSHLDKMHKLNQVERRVVGIDIEIKMENRKLIESHILYPIINLIEGSSIDKKIIDQVKNLVKVNDKVLVILDSDHTEEHVMNELIAYSEFVSVGSAILVMDTGIEFAPPQTFNTIRNWGIGSNPYTATKKFLQTVQGKNFIVDREIEYRHLITCAPEGLLRRV